MSTEATNAASSMQAHPKYLQLMSMLYVMIMLLSILMVNKIVFVFGHIMSSATFVIPFWFAISDIVAEVYGYAACRRLIWYGLICQFLFVGTSYTVVNLTHSQPPLQAQYMHAFNTLPLIFLASLLGSMAGNFINAYFISKSKIVLHGRLFWLRGIFSSAVGMVIFNLIGALIIFNSMTFREDLHLLLDTLIFKISAEPFIMILANFAVTTLKRVENIDVYDYNISYGLFKIG